MEEASWPLRLSMDTCSVLFYLWLYSVFFPCLLEFKKSAIFAVENTIFIAFFSLVSGVRVLVAAINVRTQTEWQNGLGPRQASRPFGSGGSPPE